MVRFAVLLMLALWPFRAHAQMEQQELVDLATIAAQDMLNDRDGTQAQSVLRSARAAMICPRVFHAGFIFGGQGGGCVLVARDGGGSWSYPAFFNLGAGSFGFQAGLQDAEVMMMIMTDRGLRAVIDDQFKIGVDASVAFATLGGGIEGALSGAGPDIVAFQRTRGLFAGLTLEGGLLSMNSTWNRIYYGQPLATQQIVMQMQARNQAADPLRAVMMRYGGSSPAYVQRPYSGGYPPPGGYPGPQPSYSAQPAYPPPSYPQQSYLQPGPATPPPGDYPPTTTTTTTTVQPGYTPPGSTGPTATFPPSSYQPTTPNYSSSPYQPSYSTGSSDYGGVQQQNLGPPGFRYTPNSGSVPPRY